MQAATRTGSHCLPFARFGSYLDAAPETLRAWYTTSTVETAEQVADAWIKLVHEHRPDPMRQTRWAVVHWKREILAFFPFVPIRVSNSFVQQQKQPHQNSDAPGVWVSQFPEPALTHSRRWFPMRSLSPQFPLTDGEPYISIHDNGCSLVLNRAYHHFSALSND